MNSTLSFVKDANLGERIAGIDWLFVGSELHERGFTVIKNVLSSEECALLIEAYHTDLFRKTVNMQRYRFGSGAYKYFHYPLPGILATLRENVYPFLAPVANAWMKELGLEHRFPTTHPEMIERCRAHGQQKPTALILQYGEGGFNTLHQDLYGEVYFPLQMLFTLNQVGVDYTGGEFVITEQIPRAQSKVNVLTPDRGDMVVFTTNFRPVKGSRGSYRVNMKHGVSPLHGGKRHSLGIPFHDARS